MRPGFPPEPTQSLWMPDALAARGARLRWLTAQDLHWLRELYAGEGSVVPTQGNDPDLLLGLADAELAPTDARVVHLDSCRGRG